MANAIETLRDTAPDNEASPEAIEALSTDEQLNALETRKDEMLEAVIKKIDEANGLLKDASEERAEKLRGTLKQLFIMRGKLESMGAKESLGNRTLDAVTDIGSGAGTITGGLSGVIGNQFDTAGQLLKQFEANMTDKSKSKPAELTKAFLSMAMPAIALGYLYKKITGKSPDETSKEKPSGFFGKIGKGLLGIGFAIAGVQLSKHFYLDKEKTQTT